MDEIIFLIMDITNETKKLVNNVKKSVCDSMTRDQELAYDMGVQNTLSALKSLISEQQLVVHIPGTKIPTEMDINELVAKLEE